MEWIEWEVDYRHKCVDCRDTYAARTPPGKPPCSQCKVEPMPENHVAGKIFLICRNQLVIAPTKVIDVMHSAIHSAMSLYRVKNRQECFEKILMLSSWWINRLNKEATP